MYYFIEHFMKELNMSKIITGYSLVLGVLLIAIFNFLIPGNSKAFTENITEINAFTENLEGLGFNIQIVNFNSQSINPIKSK